MNGDRPFALHGAHPENLEFLGEFDTSKSQPPVFGFLVQNLFCLNRETGCYVNYECRDYSCDDGEDAAGQGLELPKAFEDPATRRISHWKLHERSLSTK